MRTSTNPDVREGLSLLTREDLDFLIYMTSDIWITPEVRRLKMEFLQRIDPSENTMRTETDAFLTGDQIKAVSDSIKWAAWGKALVDPDYSPELTRRDARGHLIRFPEFGRTDSVFGWAIGPMYPEQEFYGGIHELHPFSLWYT